ncbi:MAG: putative copper efflux system periplasmic protein CusF [Caulobacteraceae bacterium]|nr:putative copper efflux system periplasmic protein CusF [Caulobacteraceae bacterium]
MLKLTTPHEWARHRTPGQWADHHLKVVTLLVMIAVFGSYPVGVFVLQTVGNALRARDAPAAAPSLRPIEGFGSVIAMNDTMGTITIQHSGIPQLDIPAGTTGFRASSPVIKRTEVGDQLNFRLSKEGDLYVITSVRNPVLGDKPYPG